MEVIYTAHEGGTYLNPTGTLSGDLSGTEWRLLQVACSFKMAEGLAGGDHNVLSPLVKILWSPSYHAPKGTGWNSCFQLPVAPQMPALVPTCKGWCPALESVRLLQLLAHLPTVGLVLAQDGTGLLQPPQGLEGLELMLQHGSRAADVLGQLHGHQREDLRQVVLQCVTDDAVLLIETGSAWATGGLSEGSPRR